MTLQGKKHQLRKKMLRIQKEMDKEITIWFIIDDNMSKIMKKILILSEIKNGEFWVLLKWFLEGLQASPGNHQAAVRQLSMRSTHQKQF